MDRRKLGALAFGAMLVAAACTPDRRGDGSTQHRDGIVRPIQRGHRARQRPGRGCRSARASIPAGEPLHIAYWGVLSGADSSLGEDSKQGVEIALDDMKNTFKGHDIRLTTEDGLCTPPGGATAAQKLAADSTIVGLIGSACSDETVGGIAAITAAGLTTISPSNTRPALTAADRDATYAGYLRTAHSDAFQGKAAAEFAYNELGLKTAATIHDGSAYAQALQQVFADEFKKLGGTITTQEAVTKDQKDMTSVLKKIATSNAGAAPDLIYMPDFVAVAGYLSSQIPGIAGLEKVKTMGADGHFTPDYLKAAGKAAVGHYLTSPNFSAFGSGYQDFLAKRAAKFGGNPLSVFHAHAYDATNILFAALDQGRGPER